MRADRLLLALTLALFTAALGRDAFDHWVDATRLPVIVSETSTEMRDRNGDLLRLYTVEDGRWRLSVSPDAVDRRYLDMLIGYEDKRFYRHSGVDPRAMLRALGQALWHGEIVSGGSTLTMQAARLLEDSGTGMAATEQGANNRCCHFHGSSSVYKLFRINSSSGKITSQPSAMAATDRAVSGSVTAPSLAADQ